jgi:hypothetical protein
MREKNRDAGQPFFTFRNERKIVINFRPSNTKRVAQVGEREGSNSTAQSASNMNDFSFTDVNWDKKDLL